ncbi:MAG: PQQ-binding-like beta-propeller repeat protein, partial [bacterium]|nr:PQQ-binding-like beta-propeller repeat protein [bacterium]
MFRIRLLSLALFSIGLLSAQLAAGDWPTSRGNNQRTGVAVETVKVNDWNELWVWRSSHPPQVAWAGPAKWDAYANILNLPNMRDYDRCFGVIAVGDRVWLASSADDSVYCLSAKTGEVLWSHTAEGPIRMAPTFDTGRIYFGDDSGAATCLHAETGELIWKHQAPVTRSTIIHNGRFISALPCRTGVLVQDSVARFAFGMLPWQDAYLCAVDASTGKIETASHYEKKIASATFEGPLAVAGNLLVSCQGRVPPKIFEMATGTDRGSLATGGGGAGGSFVAVTNSGDILHGPGNKAARIIRTKPGAAKPTAAYGNCKRVVAAAAGMVLAGDAGLQLISNDGKSNWKQLTGPLSEIIVAGETIIAGGENEVAAYELTSGELIWRRPVAGAACDLAISGEQLFVSTDAGTIYCFAAAGKHKAEPAVAKEDDQPAAILPPEPAGAEPTRGLISQWVFELGMEDRARRRGLPNPERFVSDQKHQNDAAMTGPLEIREAGAAQALVLNGRASVLVSDDVTKMKLPAEAITVSAWVRVDQPSQWGGIIGFLQDNGSFERGWVLGFKDNRFTFALKSKDGNGALTYLAAKDPYINRRWHHVAGVYDGKTHRIYVDGKLAGEAAAQKGAIDYPKSGFFEIGAYHDDNEQYFLNGQIHAITLHKEALTPDEVAAAYHAKSGWFPQPTQLAAGPWWRFEPGGKATVHWQTK